MKKISYFIILIVFIALITSCGTLGMSGAGDQPEKAEKLIPAKSAGTIFIYKDATATSVNLTGEFNGWDTQANPMTRKGDIWQIEIELEPGTYMYKFFVNGSDWKEDPNNPEQADDGNGGKNSVIIIGDGAGIEKKIKKPEIAAATNYSGDIPVTFTYQPLTGGKKNVFLAGDFNSWSATITQMEEKNGIYNATLNLRIGKYAYKFVVDGNWITDDNAEEFVGDGYGGQNSIIFAGNKKEIDALRKVTFQYKPDSPVTDVYLAGSMNDWNQKSDMMTEVDGVYEVTKLLKNGEYSYKFVINGSQWQSDKKATKFEDDGFGDQNSVIIVDESYPSVILQKGDGEFLQYGLPYGQSIETINPLNPHSIEFKIRVHSDDLDNVFLLIDNNQYDLQKLSEDNSFCYYGYLYEMPQNQTEFDYAFVYEDGGKTWYMTADGYDSQPYKFHYSPKIIEPFYTPDWVKDGIIYQIFPERFANGDKTNDPDFSEWYYKGINQPPAPGTLLPKDIPYYHLIKDWYDISGLIQSPYHIQDKDNRPDYNSYYGGDITGINQKLDYLTELGITIIYFNPLFQAKSNHKYDAADYMKLDPHFGTSREFKAFVADCHARDIKVIIDCAFNHTGETFWAFQDASKGNCEKSEYWDWYEWKKCPLPKTGNYTASDYYECWWGYGEMPNLNYDLALSNPEENSIKDISLAHPNQPVVDHIMEVVDFWIGEMDLDGFRLDVPNEVPFWFWQKFRERVKSIKPDAWLVGEIWSNAVEWVNNDYFDSVMNYAYFKDPVQRFFNMRQCTAQTFDRDLKPGRLTYPTQATQTMMNLIDSHDTVRFLESADGDISAIKMAAFFQMTYVGAPHIWYGDEIAMMGKRDPDCRRPFNWKYRDNSQAVDLLSYYQKLIKIRKENITLSRGSFQTLLTDRLVYAFEREYKDNKIFVLINNDSNEIVIKLPVDTSSSSLINLVDGNNYPVNDGVITIKAAPYTGYILK